LGQAIPADTVPIVPVSRREHKCDRDIRDSGIPSVSL
jgi:hypothetical protein